MLNHVFSDHSNQSQIKFRHSIWVCSNFICSRCSRVPLFHTYTNNLILYCLPLNLRAGFPLQMGTCVRDFLFLGLFTVSDMCNMKNSAVSTPPTLSIFCVLAIHNIPHCPCSQNLEWNSMYASYTTLLQLQKHFFIFLLVMDVDKECRCFQSTETSSKHSCLWSLTLPSLAVQGLSRLQFWDVNFLRTSCSFISRKKKFTSEVRKIVSFSSLLVLIKSH